MDPFSEYCLQATRRQFFGTSGLRLGSTAMAALNLPAARAGKHRRRCTHHCPASRTFPQQPKPSSTCT